MIEILIVLGILYVGYLIFRKKGEKILFLQILAFAACKIHKIRV